MPGVTEMFIAAKKVAAGKNMTMETGIILIHPNWIILIDQMHKRGCKILTNHRLNKNSRILTNLKLNNDFKVLISLMHKKYGKAAQIHYPGKGAIRTGVHQKLAVAL